MDPLIGAGSVSAWVVPGVIFLLVIVASAAGLLWIRSEHLETLHAVPLFSGLSRRDLMSVLRSTSGVGYERGSELVKEGDTGKGFFIVTKGTATVSVGGDAGRHARSRVLLRRDGRARRRSQDGHDHGDGSGVRPAPPSRHAVSHPRYATDDRASDRRRADPPAVVCRRAGRTDGPRRPGSSRGP